MNANIVELAIKRSTDEEILLHTVKDESLLKLPFTKCIDGESTISGVDFITNNIIEVDKESIVGYTWWSEEQKDIKQEYINSLNNKMKFLNDFIKKTEKSIIYSHSLNNIFYSESSNPIALYVFNFENNIDLNNTTKLEYAKEKWLNLINFFKEDQINILEEEKAAIISTLSEEHRDYFISDFEMLKNTIIERASDTNIFYNCKTPGDIALCWPSVLEPNPSISISMV